MLAFIAQNVKRPFAVDNIRAIQHYRVIGTLAEKAQFEPFQIAGQRIVIITLLLKPDIEQRQIPMGNCANLVVGMVTRLVNV